MTGTPAKESLDSPNRFAYEVADNIYWAAHSGSAVWDEVNGDDATWHAEQEGSLVKHFIRIPAEYADDGETALRWVSVTVEMELEEPPFDQNHHNYHTPNKPLDGCAWCEYAGWLR